MLVYESTKRHRQCLQGCVISLNEGEVSVCQYSSLTTKEAHEDLSPEDSRSQVLHRKHL
jgi:hypothetical protein